MDSKAFSFNSQANDRTGGHFKETTAFSLANQEIMVDDKGSQLLAIFPDILAVYIRTLRSLETLQWKKGMANLAKHSLQLVAVPA